MDYTDVIIQRLKEDSMYVTKYLKHCKDRGVLPSCSDWERSVQIDYNEYYHYFSRKRVTQFLREWYRAMR